ncbi:hypothetical protein [Streptomyces sp. NPDC046985]|uniref:hypothetical protein n=1 Tax=Streptomyces sp. NPDC046985 TaxID=3155377 RepID=UPI0033ECC372
MTSPTDSHTSAPAGSEWRPADLVSEPAYHRDRPQSGRALLDFHLRRLGLGAKWVTRDFGRGCRVGRHVWPKGIGVCRAYALTEAAWPPGADLCATVDWSPDEAWRRDHQRGTVPPGAEEHWQERIAATAAALESCGYAVEPSRFKCSPHYVPRAEFLVYRMPAGSAPRPAPARWALGEPVPPHYRQPERRPDENPPNVVESALHNAWTRSSASRPAGQVVVRSITQTVWPPEADLCAWLRWRPAAAYVRDPGTGVLPAGAEQHWSTSLNRLEAALTDAGLTCRSRERPWSPDTDDGVDLLVSRACTLP